MLLDFLPLGAPLALVLSAALATISPGRRQRALLRAAEFSALVAIGVAIVSAVLLGFSGTSSAGIGASGFGVSVRRDALSITMVSLVSFIGWVVVRYSATYLDGEARQGAFTGWLCLTLAAVLLLVLSGDLVQLVLAWIATSLFLHRLLLFYPERVAARRAAAKKFVTARIGDAALVVAAVLLAQAYDTADIAAILGAARAGAGGAPAVAAAGLLAVAAVLKSAQFPVHGWLTEVMEAPTPVSALLHAGVINAGGFLLIRFADVMLLAPAMLALLVVIGGFTALFGGAGDVDVRASRTSMLVDPFPWTGPST